MLFTRLNSPNACPQPLLEPSRHCPCTPVASCQCLPEFNKSGQPVSRLACSFGGVGRGPGSKKVAYWLQPHYLSEQVPRGMSHSYTSPVFPWARKRRGCQKWLCSMPLCSWQMWSGSQSVTGGCEGMGWDPMQKGWADWQGRGAGGWVRCWLLENFLLPCLVPVAALLISPGVGGLSSLSSSLLGVLGCPSSL